jgi:glycosyltransferase involved in cell wall biosynthesis
VCVEDVDSDRPAIGCDEHQGGTVHRLHAQLTRGGEALGFIHSHPVLETLVHQVFADVKPDIVHLQSGYLLGGPVLAAARAHQIPVVVTLHDYWFICPRITLVHPSGHACSGPDGNVKCAWCLATVKRRFRLPDRLTGGGLTRFVVGASRPSTRHPLLFETRGARAAALRQTALLSLLAEADLILSPSAFVRRQMSMAGVDERRIEVSQLGIQLPARVPTHEASDVMRIGYLGQIAWHKGIHVLVEAVRRLPSQSVQLRIYGDDTRDAAYTEQIRRLIGGDRRIAILGRYRNDRVYDILAQVDVLVVPSLWAENSPTVIHEAQAAAVPVIGSRLGGIPELVENGINGLLFEAGNVGELSAHLARCLAQPSLVTRLRPDPRSVRSAEHEAVALQHRYRRLLRGRSAANVRAR